MSEQRHWGQTVSGPHIGMRNLSPSLKHGKSSYRVLCSGKNRHSGLCLGAVQGQGRDHLEEQEPAGAGRWRTGRERPDLGYSGRR